MSYHTGETLFYVVIKYLIKSLTAMLHLNFSGFFRKVSRPWYEAVNRFVLVLQHHAISASNLPSASIYFSNPLTINSDLFPNRGFIALVFGQLVKFYYLLSAF